MFSAAHMQASVAQAQVLGIRSARSGQGAVGADILVHYCYCLIVLIHVIYDLTAQALWLTLGRLSAEAIPFDDHAELALKCTLPELPFVEELAYNGGGDVFGRRLRARSHAMLSPELRDVVVSYIRGQRSLDSLIEWYTPRVFDLIADPHSPDADLVAAIELCLAEMDDGIRSEDEARGYLQAVLEEHGIALSPSLIIYRIAQEDVPSTTTLSASYTTVDEREYVDREQFSSPVYFFS